MAANVSDLDVRVETGTEGLGFCYAYGMSESGSILDSDIRDFSHDPWTKSTLNFGEIDAGGSNTATYHLQCALRNHGRIYTYKYVEG
jgi:hypothetical protein